MAAVAATLAITISLRVRESTRSSSSRRCAAEPPTGSNLGSMPGIVAGEP